jgi:hypothetical protein
MNISTYYSLDICTKIFNAVSNPQWRVWKVEDIDGRFRQARRRINSPKRLKEFIGTKASKVYNSIGQFLHPETVYGAKPKHVQWVIADSIILSAELLFDLDSETDLSIAVEDGRKIIDFMAKEQGYRLKNIRYSGSKGFHILYEDLKPWKHAHPKARLMYIKLKRQELVSRLPELKTIDELHKGIIADPFRVHASLYTIKSKTGNIVKEIPVEDFMTLPIATLISSYVQSVVRPKRSMIDEFVISTSLTGKERPTLISYPLSYKFVDNKVKGTKDMRVIVLKFPLYRRVDNLLREAQKRYNLSDFDLFLHKDHILAICMKLVDKNRLMKIMKFTKPMNMGSQIYYDHTWIPISSTIDNNGRVVWEKPKWLCTIISKYGLFDTHSRPHLSLLNIAEGNIAGSEYNTVCVAEIKGS